MKKYIIFILTITSMLLSCSSKQAPIDCLSNLAEELSENGDNYSDTDWESAVEQFERISENLEDYSYTNDEQREIGKLKMRICYLFGSKYGMNKLKQFVNELSGAMEELNDSIKTDDLKTLFGN